MLDRAHLFTFTFLSIAALALASCARMQTGPSLTQSAQSQMPSRATVHGAATTFRGYAVKDLGSLASDSESQVGQGTITAGEGLNNLGQAAGLSWNPGADPTATLFDNGNAIDINTIRATASMATAINDSGQVVGQETRSGEHCGCWHAFLYSNGAMTNIENTAIFPFGSEAYGINKTGQVVGTGFLDTNDVSYHAFLYSGGQMTDLNPFNAPQSLAISINDSGQIIGYTLATISTPAVATWLYSNGTFTNLSTTNRGAYINDNGQIAGHSTSTQHAVLYSNGTWTDLGLLSGTTSSVANSVNLSGQVVGSSTFPATYHPFKSPRPVAVVFTSSGPVDLNTLIPPSSGFTLTSAQAINNSGQIACNAKISTGGFHAVLLTPK